MAAITDDEEKVIGYVDLLTVVVKGKKGRPPANDGRDLTRIQKTDGTIGLKTRQRLYNPVTSTSA